MHTHLGILCPCLMALLACAAAPPKVEVKPAAAPLPAPRVEKLREPLEVTPLELHFSGLRGAPRVTESVAVKNTGSEPVQVSDVRLVGLQTETFRIVDAPLLPVVLSPAGAFSYTVAFEPAADAALGVHHARVRLVRGDDDGPPCDLTGLVTQSLADEPPLAQILDALGYDVDVGAASLALSAESVGDQIDLPTFQRAKPGNVGYYLIARYSPAEDTQFGYYVIEKGKPATQGIGSVSKEHNHTLNPELDESRGSFDIGETAFGLYLKTGAHARYSDKSLNAGKAVARVYPLRSRGRTPVPDALVVAFDTDGDNDFQDYVFMLWNVKTAK
jgi:hypothetical protein